MHFNAFVLTDMEHARLQKGYRGYSAIKGVALGLLAVVLGIVASGCSRQSQDVAARNVTYYQDWSIEPGDNLAGYQVQSGLGDISINLDGNNLFMPFDGTVQPQAEKEDLCVVLSSPDVPAYLFRLCGMRQPRFGDHSQGQVIGSGDVVAFATMRRQADGTWALVEPAKELIEQFLVQDP
jgi:hypothetical protein